VRRRVAGRARLLRVGLFACVVGFVVLNGIAWMQARAMTHYSPGSVRSPRIEDMTTLEKGWAIVAGVSVPRPSNSHTPANAGLAYETRRIDAGGGEQLEAWYVPAPEPARIVLMFPGYAESKESLLGAAAALHGLHYDTLPVDFRGEGGSSGQDTTLGVREGTDVAIAFRYARHVWPSRPVVLYGVSMGAAAVLRAGAWEGVTPDAVILESPFDRLVSTVGNRLHSMGLPAFPSAQLLVLWGSMQQGFDGFEHNPVDYARSVTRPALVLHGELDPRATPEQARAVFGSLGGPKEFVSFAGAAHESLVARDPALWKDKVAGFLGGIGR
jgi:alpha-beta hydrolase superfamily lysophospholipase